ncbi:tryptophan synthase subunit alpha [Aliiglaciecola sp. CAU 1673]|uniref:tryptophan synthase subunit alpha n=1 Tax=Aliiglaciecola sp. CAU 1673 TaxID=3032595 RepID=UPI0023D9DCF1|nr:tryptophan synthase subunit alpha [Aliiglaciecola sp. CAU 1673]MDF2178782.1 tryptophan synthase subunit alpha [Aliiglaciecola sp. CAU 1673]
MDRYQQLFATLHERGEGAFVPFVMLGDPSLEDSFDIIEALISGGADALELGIPFSDPIADGPTIQQAAIRALDKGVTPKDCFNLMAKVRAAHPNIPIGLLLYSNLVLAPGIDQFYAMAAKAGVDSILIADVPVRESAPFHQAAKNNSIQQILIAPPNASEETFADIGHQSGGYTYLLGRAGVTGAETAAVMPPIAMIQKLKSVNAAPPLLGFGISTPSQVKAAIEAGAAGAISGSAVVKLITENLGNKSEMLKKLQEFVYGMKQATKASS